MSSLRLDSKDGLCRSGGFSTTSNYAVLGELGRFPLAVVCKQRALCFWIKILKNPSSLMYTVLREQMTLLYNSNIHATSSNLWCKSLKAVLDNLGFGYAFDNGDLQSHIIPMLIQRLMDQYVQNWNDTIVNQSKMSYYCMFKKDYQFEKYIECITNDRHRKNMSRFRLSAHCLQIEVGRYTGVLRDDRKCILCNQNACESEYHFLLCCPLYNELRRKYDIKSSWPSLNRFTTLMSSCNAKIINNLSKYITEAFKLRTETIKVLAAS